MNWRRVRRWTLYPLAALAGVPLLVWLLRWPLLGGIVRAELGKVLAAELKGELRDARFSGDLLSSLRAEDLRIAGGPDAPFDEILVRRAEVSYGFLGRGRLEVRLEGLRADFVDREPDKPADDAKTLRDAEEIVRTFKFPGRLALRDGLLTLPDGTRIDVAEAAVDETGLRARARVPGFGEIVASRTGSVLEARAAEGPVRRARLEWNGAAVRFSLRIEDREVEGHGRVVYGPDGVLVSAEGEAVAPELGRATLKADFRTGRVAGRAEIAYELEDPLQARIAAAGRVAGPILGPLRDWILTEAVASAARATWNDLEFEDVHVDIPEATFDLVAWKARARRGPDRIEGEGNYRAEQAEGAVRAWIQDTTPYVPEVAARDVLVRGRFRVDGGFRFDGRVESGPGEVEGVTWTSLAAEVAAGPDGVEVPSLLVKGLPRTPEASISGAVDILDGPRYAIRADARAGEDRLALEGILDGKRFDGRFAGRGVVEGIRAVASGRIARDERSTRIALEPGEVEGIRHGPLELELFEGRAEVEETDVSIAAPPASARISGTIRWAEGKVSGEARARNLLLRGRAMGAAAGRFTSGKDLEIDAAWAAESGIGAELRGRWGESNDLSFRARVPDLSAPLVRRFLEGAPALKGAASLDLHIGGSAERPEPSGALTVLAALEGAPPLNLRIPLRSEGRRVVAALKDEVTPYGRLTLDARLPLPGAEEPLEAKARFEARALSAFSPFLPEAVRPYVPEGELDVETSATGEAWAASVDLRVPFGRLPEPFAPVTDLAARGTIDATGLRIERLTGRLGGGRFEASVRRETDASIRGSLRGRELLAIATRLSHIRLSADLTFAWEPGKPGLLSGTVSVPLALIHEEPGSPGGGGEDVAVGGLRLRPAPGGGVAVPGVEGMEAVKLDLGVEAKGEIRVENSIVGALLRAQGRLGGTLAAPSASGTVETISGEVKLPAAIFVRIEEARITIPAEPGADPSVHFVGRVGKGEGSIELRVDGPLARPELVLQSDPPRPKEELLARLAFGHPPGQVEGAALGTFALRLYEQYTAGWPQAEPREGFFSRLRPTVVSEEGEDPRRVPWELPSGRTARGMIVRTEYLWTPFFSVVGEADREANVGGDIKLRLRFE